MKLESLLLEVPLLMHDKAVVTLTMNNWAKATHAVSTSEYQNVYCVNCVIEPTEGLHQAAWEIIIFDQSRTSTALTAWTGKRFALFVAWIIWHLITKTTNKVQVFFCCGAAAQRGSWPPHSWGFLDHTQRRTTVGRTPLDEWSAPIFQDNRRMKVVRLSALRTGCLYPPGNIPGTHFC